MKKTSIIYFYVHLVIEIASFFIVEQYLPFEYAIYFALIYDFLAFVPQGLFGYFVDKKTKYFILPIGLIISCVAILLFNLNLSGFLVIPIISIGNAIIHISGAEDTLRCSNGKISPAAIFVSGGSFGVILGKIMASNKVPSWIILLLLLTLIVPIILLWNTRKNYNPDNLEQYNFKNEKIDPVIIVLLAIFVVAIRAYMGYGIPSSWNKSLAQSIALFFLMGIGKALGGILIDTIGIKPTIILSTVCAAPFLAFGDNLMIISLFGVLLFSMTMSITLAIIVSCMKKYPGVAFGMTTIGLFLGTLPTFFNINSSKIFNIILIIFMSVLSLIVLLFISKKGGEKND